MHCCHSVTFDGRLAESPTTLPPEPTDGDPLSATVVPADLSTLDQTEFFVTIDHFDPEAVPLLTPTPRSCPGLAHGATLGPVLRGGREVTIKGRVHATHPEGREKALRALREIWRVADCPTPTDRSLYELRWKSACEDCTQERFVMAQLAESLTVWAEDCQQPFCTRWSVKLRTADDRVYIDDLQSTEVCAEGYVGGIDLGEGGVSYCNTPLDDLFNCFTIESLSTVKTPVRITLTIDPTWVDPLTQPPHPPGLYTSVDPAVNPTVVNATTGTAYTVPVTMQLGDTVVIDGFTQTVTHNGVPVAAGFPYNAFPSLVAGENVWVVTDLTDFFRHGQALCAQLEYYPAIV